MPTTRSTPNTIVTGFVAESIETVGADRTTKKYTFKASPTGWYYNGMVILARRATRAATSANISRSQQGSTQRDNTVQAGYARRVRHHRLGGSKRAARFNKGRGDPEMSATCGTANTSR